MMFRNVCTVALILSLQSLANEDVVKTSDINSGASSSIVSDISGPGNGNTIRKKRVRVSANDWETRNVVKSVSWIDKTAEEKKDDNSQSAFSSSIIDTVTTEINGNEKDAEIIVSVNHQSSVANVEGVPSMVEAEKESEISYTEFLAGIPPNAHNVDESVTSIFNAAEEEKDVNNKSASNSNSNDNVGNGNTENTENEQESKNKGRSGGDNVKKGDSTSASTAIIDISNNNASLEETFLQQRFFRSVNQHKKKLAIVALMGYLFSSANWMPSWSGASSPAADMSSSD